MKRLFGALVVGALALGCARQEGRITAPTSGGIGVAQGAVAPPFVTKDIEGNEILLSKHLGKDVILLNFCATWCEPCLLEFPHLRRMYDANKGKGFFIMAISMDGPETVANVPGFARRNQLNFPMATDDDSHIAALYNPRKAAPLSIVIDKAGKIVAVHEGFNVGDEDIIAKDIAKALEGAP